MKNTGDFEASLVFFHNHNYLISRKCVVSEAHSRQSFVVTDPQMLLSTSRNAPKFNYGYFIYKFILKFRCY